MFLFPITPAAGVGGPFHHLTCDHLFHLGVMICFNSFSNLKVPWHDKNVFQVLSAPTNSENEEGKLVPHHLCSSPARITGSYRLLEFSSHCDVIMGVICIGRPLRENTPLSLEIHPV